MLLNLYDILLISHSSVNVMRNNRVAKLKHLLFYLMIFWSIIVSWILIAETELTFRYAAVPICVIFLGVYKFIYLRAVDNELIYLQISDSILKYYIGTNVIEIPLNSIMKAEDKSFYFDSQDIVTRGWNHSIVLTVYPGCVIEQETKLQKLFTMNEDSASLTLNNLYLNHTDHNKLFKILSEMVSR